MIWVNLSTACFIIIIKCVSKCACDQIEYCVALCVQTSCDIFLILESFKWSGPSFDLFLCGSVRVWASCARPSRSAGTTTQRRDCRPAAWRSASTPSPRQATPSTHLPRSAWSPWWRRPTATRTFLPKSPTPEHSHPNIRDCEPLRSSLQ